MPRLHALRAVIVPCALATLLVPAAAHAQSWKDRVKSAAVRGATDAATRKAEEAARTGTEKSIDAALTAAGEKAGALVAEKAGTDAKADGKAAAPAVAGAGKSSAEAWANYDFVPGTRPLFVEDFANDNVGDFPKRLKWENGNYEVVEHLGARWMRATTFGSFSIPLPEVLPERFTLELEMIAPNGWGQEIHFAPKASGVKHRVSISRERGGVYVDGNGTLGAPAERYVDTPIPVRVMADGQHVKVFMGQTRVANIPQVDLGRDRAIRFSVSAEAKHPMLIGNVRVMAGGRALYDAIAASGRVATQGIRFATSSDALLGESTPTLKEIAAMLKAHPQLALTIEGHTDSAGSAAANQRLSEQRAAAVKAALVSSYGVDAARLTTQGFGASKPVMPNSTDEGRAANRRVELVKR
jgi:outer membrane protein OmpA-like peptidoglycan-associated protein